MANQFEPETPAQPFAVDSPNSLYLRCRETFRRLLRNIMWATQGDTSAVERARPVTTVAMDYEIMQELWQVHRAFMLWGQKTGGEPTSDSSGTLDARIGNNDDHAERIKQTLRDFDLNLTRGKLLQSHTATDQPSMLIMT